MRSFISVENATANNLRGVSARIPKNTFTCIAGRSGSGKSSFAIDVLFRACSEDRGETAGRENVVRGVVPAIAVMQRTQLDRRPISVANYLGLTDYLLKADPRFKACDACGGKGVRTRLIPEKALINPERPVLGTALHPILRPVLGAGKGQLRDYQGKTAFQDLPDTCRQSFLFGSGTTGEWRGLEEEIHQAIAAGDLEVSEEDITEAFFAQEACAACGGIGARVGEAALQGAVRRFAKGAPLEEWLPRCLRNGVLGLTRPVSRLSLGQFQWARILVTLRKARSGMLVLMDEPTAGMCKEDSIQIVELCKHLVDYGCTVVVIEHSPIVILNADHVIEFGPGGGREGGRVVFSGDQKALGKSKSALLCAIKDITHARTHSDSSGRSVLSVCGVQEYGLNDIDLAFPERRWTCIAGTIGSGKTGAVDVILRQMDKSAGAWVRRIGLGEVTGRNKIRRPHIVDQRPIGLNPQSIPLTYIDAMSALRDRFAEAAQASGCALGPEHFSFNTDDGQCPTCHGGGYVEGTLAGEPYLRPCEECQGSRYNRRSLSVKVAGKSIAQVLRMTVSEGREFFEDDPLIARKLAFLMQVGLGYLVMGQPSNSLSGGESQRVKIAKQLSKKLGDRSLYLLDTPSRGLSILDVQAMIDVFRQIVAKNNTVVTADNHPGFILECDWLLVLDRGKEQTTLLYSGPPQGLPVTLLDRIAGTSTLARLLVNAKAEL